MTTPEKNSIPENASYREGDALTPKPVSQEDAIIDDLFKGVDVRYLQTLGAQIIKGKGDRDIREEDSRRRGERIYKARRASPLRL